MTVTFTSRAVRNHVLEGVRHLANRIVVFLKYCVFSCLAELLHVDEGFFEKNIRRFKRQKYSTQ